jgi:hypothetical protein
MVHGERSQAGGQHEVVGGTGHELGVENGDILILNFGSDWNRWERQTSWSDSYRLGWRQGSVMSTTKGGCYGKGRAKYSTFNALMLFYFVSF